jgi:hypothetical protein
MSNFYFLVQLIRSLTAPRLRCAEQLTLVKIAPIPSLTTMPLSTPSLLATRKRKRAKFKQWIGRAEKAVEE